MSGSYQLQSFTKNKETEITRLKAQVELFFRKEFELYQKIGLKDGMDIIECGSGPGYLIKSILEKFPHCKATALEIDPFLFSVLSENSIDGGKQIYNPVNESIYETKLPENSFDFVITRLVIEHLEEPLKAIFELYRILKQGGKLVIISNDFANHLLTYPVIPELHEMYEAYCKSRFSEGGNPLIGRLIPVYLESSNFKKINFEIVTAHSKLSGDEAFLKAENVNISKSLVEGGFLNRNSLANLIEKWFEMLKDPNHVFYRQLFVISGEKNNNALSNPYSKDLEMILKGKSKSEVTVDQQTNLDNQREKFRSLINKHKQSSPSVNINQAGQKYMGLNDTSTVPMNNRVDAVNSRTFDKNKIEDILLQVWKEILNNDSITKDDNYFDIGGDSVLIPEIIQRLSEKFEIKLRILDVFDNPSIRQLSDYIREN
jgi:ubiquinone/menaquinone biosynthesis C-methylase UbiE/acyl carrier protein